MPYSHPRNYSQDVLEIIRLVEPVNISLATYFNYLVMRWVWELGHMPQFHFLGIFYNYCWYKTINVYIVKLGFLDIYN